MPLFLKSSEFARKLRCAQVCAAVEVLALASAAGVRQAPGKRRCSQVSLALETQQLTVGFLLASATD